jgi:hypothetical protein
MPGLPSRALVLLASAVLWSVAMSALQIDCASSDGGGRAGNGDDAAALPRASVTIATYNVEWLFDGVGDTHTPWRDSFDAQRHLEAIANDIVGVRWWMCGWTCGVCGCRCV